jgi:hypothetical protein
MSVSSRFFDENSLSTVVRLEPMQAAGRQGVLVAGVQDDFAPCGEIALVSAWNDSLGAGRRLSFDIKIDDAPAAAERFLLAGVSVIDRGMMVFGADLAREEDDLLGAIAIVRGVNDHLESVVVEVVQAEVGDFYFVLFARGDRDPGLGKNGGRSLSGFLDVFKLHVFSLFPHFNRDNGRNQRDGGGAPGARNGNFLTAGVFFGSIATPVGL